MHIRLYVKYKCKNLQFIHKLTASGQFYKYVNNKLNGSNGIAPLKNNVGKLVHTDTDKAELLNNYFSSVFTIDNGIIDSSRLPDIQLTTSAVPPVFFTPALII